MTRTNRYGDPELVPGHYTWFGMWPIYFNAKKGIGTTNPVEQKVVFPFYNQERSPNLDITTVLWPFFTHLENREKSYVEYHAPWPLVVWGKGEGKTTRRVWPFYGRTVTPTRKKESFGWPLYTDDLGTGESLDRRKIRVAFLLYSDLCMTNKETGATSRKTHFWPLFMHRREFDGRTRLQVLSVLEPLTQGSHKVDREFSPLWALWRAENNPRTGNSSQSLLWNLYRRDQFNAGKKTSLLFGLFQYESTADEKRMRVFYVPVGGHAQPGKNAQASTGPGG